MSQDPNPKSPQPTSFASRAGFKLDYALDEFGLDVSGQICADLGCSTGGFTDCLLRRGATRIYSVDTGYGVLDWKLRNDPRVIVMERTNALHLHLPEMLDFISIDVSWTRQKLILPKALTLLKPVGNIVSLVKPHYEAGIAHLTEQKSGEIFTEILQNLRQINIIPNSSVKSPLVGEKGKNTEYLIWIHRP